MPPTTAVETSVAASQRNTIVNDIVIQVATTNGSGSQSSNNVLLRAIFQMGIPVNGKNLFPSNIQGMPTWFTIRANKDGWAARRETIDFLVAMNPESAAEDLRELRPGGVAVLSSELKPYLNRSDIHAHIVPFGDLVAQVCPEVKVRKLVANMVYVGVVGCLLSIEIEEIQKAIARQFRSKPKAADLNRNAAMLGYNWAAEHLHNGHEFTLERMHRADGQILIEGNAATALGFLYGGVTVVGWYPITPSSSVCENLIALLGKHRHDPATGKATYAVLQAEDEIAAIGFVLGAGWAGARAVTATSGPGLSLMAEFAGLSYFAEVPAVIADIQRMGPSTGLPTRTCQGDILKAHLLSHGDCRHILLIPGSVEECYEFAMESLDLAERFQTLVLFMSDLDLGMNHWVSAPFQPPAKDMDRGKVLTAEDLARLKKFERYRDVDGDGIPYRTLPGAKHPLAAYFTRGTGHTAAATYSEKPEDWKNNLDRLTRKFDTAREAVPQPVLEKDSRSDIGVIAYGSSDPAVRESLAQLQAEAGVDAAYLRIRALPVNGMVREFLASRRVTYLVEQNRDAQMASVLRMEYPELSAKIRSVLHYDGLPITARVVTDAILESENRK
ncbi:MAG: 2-oxoacid:acceptor oxidoreductase subunit alpha [Verrucomicrobia bacterium]|nr:2-oxoacid:acceptor oxidoreductase subunit alpha [Verrucomicrobiota bacterium]